MAWVLVIIAGCFEVGFALLLKQSDGFSKLWPTIGFAICALVSFGLLTISLKDLPVGTAYAVWVGIGAALTAGYAMAAGTEPVSVLRVLLLAGIVGCVIGLKLTH